MAQLDIVKAEVLRPIIDRLETSGSNTHALLEQAGLSPIILERAGSVIPQFAAWRFAELAARFSGCENFNYDSIISPITRSSRQVAGLSIGNDNTAFEALKKFVKTMDQATSGTNFYLKATGQDFWILRKSSLESRIAEWQVELFVIAVVSRAVTNILGRNWKPTKIAIKQRAVPGNLPKDLSMTQIYCQSETTGVAVDAREFANAVNFSMLSHRPALLYSELVTNQVSEAFLRDIIAMYGKNWNSNIDVVAEAFGMSARTFQRRLHERGLRFSDLLGDARFHRAVEMLGDQKVSITELAFELGYPYPNHFTRAFKRRAGVSPRAYRKMVRDYRATEPR